MKHAVAAKGYTHWFRSDLAYLSTNSQTRLVSGVRAVAYEYFLKEMVTLRALYELPMRALSWHWKRFENARSGSRSESALCDEVMNAIGTRDATRCLCTAFTEDRHTSVDVCSILKLACLLASSLLFTAFSAILEASITGRSCWMHAVGRMI